MNYTRETGPLSRKLIPILAALYVAWPLDIIPDVVPIVGWLDDLVAIVIGVKALLAHRR